jgi:integrase
VSIKVRRFRTGGFEVDIHTVAPDGTPIRERVKSPVGSKEATKRWGLLREAHLALEHGKGGCRCKANSHEEEPNDEKKLWNSKKYLLDWVEQRKAEDAHAAEADEQRLKDHVVPVIGNIKMIDLRPKHAFALVKALKRTPSRRGGLLAPRTVRGIYFLTKQAFDEAVVEEILVANPMLLKKGVLPSIADKDAGWRETAVFTVGEVEQIISDPRIAEHRRVAYAIEFITGLRTGQVSALAWGDYEAAVQPLGRLTSALTWDSKAKLLKATKTKATFKIPVHPTLATVLARWKLAGWTARMGRPPSPTDLIVPTINNTHRDVRKALEDFYEDLERLGLRRRRHYDSRRTFISLGLDSGAPKDVLMDITHPRPKDAFDLYRSLAWLAKCEAVMKLKIELKEGTVMQLSRRRAAGGTGDVAETEARDGEGRTA